MKENTKSMLRRTVAAVLALTIVSGVPAQVFPKLFVDTAVTASAYTVSAGKFEDLQEYVKQLDFVFSDGSEGSVFILVKANAIVGRKLLLDMFIAMVLIMLITASVVTFWNKKGILDPLSQISKGLTQVREGNFDYVIEHDGVGGDVGELLRNYEDMRMRLRENEERTAEQEQKNKLEQDKLQLEREKIKSNERIAKQKNSQ